MDWLAVPDVKKLKNYGFVDTGAGVYAYTLDAGDMPDFDVNEELTDVELLYNPDYGFGIYVGGYEIEALDLVISIPNVLVRLIQDGVVITGGNSN